MERLAGDRSTRRRGIFLGVDMASPKREAGISGALARDVAAAGPLLPLADGEQIALALGDGADRAVAVAEARRIGRPRGSTNRQTAEFRRFYLSRYAHPLEVLGQLITRPVEAVRAELGCTALEAMQLQVRAASELAPYIEGKMPVSVDLVQRSDVRLFIPGVNAPAGEDLDEIARMVIDGEAHEENQEVSE